MRTIELKTHTPWRENVESPNYPKLSSNETFDVCVIGAGIAGLTTAYLLSKSGYRVCVVESLAGIGQGQTGLTTAHATIILDERFSRLTEIHGEEKIKLVVQSHQAALKKIKDIVASEKIDCDFEKTSGYLCFSRDEQNQIDDEVQCLDELGLRDFVRLSQSPLRTFESGECLVFPNQYQFHPLKYLNGLAEAILNRGGKIFCGTRVTEVNSGAVVRIETEEKFSIEASSVVVATNSPINNLVALHTKQAPYRSYVVAYKVPRHTVPPGLYWDTQHPYHYLRTQPCDGQYDYFIAGGNDHKTGQNDNPDACLDYLQAWVTDHFAFAQNCVHRWSGQIMEPIDGLPFLGHNPLDRKNVYVITGQSGCGMAQSTIGAMLITDQVQGIKNVWEDVYNPSRVQVRSLGRFLKENANVAAQYVDWLSPKSIEAIEGLRLGEGMVVNSGLKKIAVYRLPNDTIKACSAVCPHLKGIVHWNDLEKTWDCPCHGSRFDSSGHVIEGPTTKDLERVEIQSLTPAGSLIAVNYAMMELPLV